MLPDPFIDDDASGNIYPAATTCAHLVKVSESEKVIIKAKTKQ